jgi:hypothetical protein
MFQTSRESINLIQIDVKEILKSPKNSLFNSVLFQCITTVVSSFFVLPLNVVLLFLSFSDNWLTGFVLVNSFVLNFKSLVWISIYLVTLMDLCLTIIIYCSNLISSHKNKLKIISILNFKLTIETIFQLVGISK